MSGLRKVPADERVVEQPTEEHHVSSTVYGSREAAEGIKRFELQDEEMSAQLAARMIRDELLMDANPHLNLASFESRLWQPTALQAAH
ncbi:hypothetical protein JCM8097_000239 [Rhodosporidiobolus ruineniae]